MESRKIMALKGINGTLGLVIAMGFVFIAFEWGNYDEHHYVGKSAEIVYEYVEVMMPITYPEKKTTSIPLPKHRAIFDVLEVVQYMPDDLNEPLDFSHEEEKTANTPIIIDLPGDIGEEDDNVPLFFADVMPQFPGGDNALMQFLSEHINYPYLAAENGIEGKVMVRFIVTETGAIDQVEIIRSVHGVLDQEAIRVVKKMPRWKPGSQRGRNVSVYFTLPVRFTLR